MDWHISAEIGSQPFAIVELRSGPDKLQDLNIVLEDCQRDSDVVYLLESASLMDGTWLAEWGYDKIEEA